MAQRINGVARSEVRAGSGDRHEREASAVAHRVVGMGRTGRTTPTLTPFQDHCPTAVDDRSGGLPRAGGRSLPPAVRSFMEPRFGRDFSRVRVHTDRESAESARALGAAAFARGNHIVFGPGRFDPESVRGRRLIAHELAHVVQQSAGGAAPAGPGPVQCEGEAESEAAPMLTHPRFVGDRGLEKILLGETEALSSRHNGRNRAVSKVQHALVDLGFELPMHRADGRFGGETRTAIRQFRDVHGPTPGDEMDGPALAVLDRVAPAPGKSHEHTVDYDRLLEDRLLEITVALGATDATAWRDTGPGPRDFEDTKTPVEDIEAARFREWMTGEGFERELWGWSGNEYWKLGRPISWTGSDGTEKTREVDIWINLVLPGKGAAREFREGLGSDEITIYLGHARYGSGPDFDAKKSPVENFRIGIDTALKKAGRRTRAQVARAHEVALDQEHDLRDMVNSGDFDPDKYRVLFFNACTSLAYLDEIRSEIGGAGTTDVVATRAKSKFTSRVDKINVDEIVVFLEGILNADSVESIVAGMDELQRKLYGKSFPRKGVFSSSGFGDNPRAP